MKKLVFSALIMALLAACTKEEITSFQAKPGINFVGTSLSYSFLGNLTGEYVQEIPVRIIGDSADHDRIFTAEVVRDTFTTAAGNLYQIIGGEVKAGQFEGVLRIKLFNTESLQTNKARLKVRLVSGADFNVGNVEANEFVVSWTDQIVLPAWTYYSYFFTTKGSTAAYKIIVSVTGLTTFTATQYRAVGAAGAEALGTLFGDYVKQWNKDHPGDPLRHDNGDLAGQEIVPLYYSHSKYD